MSDTNADIIIIPDDEECEQLTAEDVPIKRESQVLISKTRPMDIHIKTETNSGVNVLSGDRAVQELAAKAIASQNDLIHRLLMGGNAADDLRARNAELDTKCHEWQKKCHKESQRYATARAQWEREGLELRHTVATSEATIASLKEQLRVSQTRANHLAQQINQNDTEVANALKRSQEQVLVLSQENNLLNQELDNQLKARKELEAETRSGSRELKQLSERGLEKEVIGLRELNAFRGKRVDELSKCAEELKEKVKQLEQNVYEKNLRMASIKSQMVAKIDAHEREMMAAVKRMRQSVVNPSLTTRSRAKRTKRL